MRPVLGFVLAACVSLLPLALGGGNASAGFECGTFDGKFTCRSSSEGAQFGKNASPGGAPVTNQNSAPEPPAGGPDAIPPGRGCLDDRSRHGGGNARCDRLPARNGRYAAQLPMPEELGAARRQLRALHRFRVQQWLGPGRPAPSLPRRRGEALLQNASGRLQGLLLRDVRQVLGVALRPRPLCRARDRAWQARSASPAPRRAR